MGRWTRRYSGTHAAAPAVPLLRCSPPSRHRPREGWGRRRPSRSMRRLGCRSVFLRARTARRHAQHVGTSAQQGPCHSPATPPPHRRHTPWARHGAALNTTGSSILHEQHTLQAPRCTALHRSSRPFSRTGPAPLQSRLPRPLTPRPLSRARSRSSRPTHPILPRSQSRPDMTVRAARILHRPRSASGLPANLLGRGLTFSAALAPSRLPLPPLAVPLPPLGVRLDVLTP